MAPWQKVFLRVGLGVAKSLVPGVSAVEAGVQALKAGTDKQTAVTEIVKGSLIAADALTADDHLLSDPDFTRGVQMQIDGAVLVMKAVQRHQATDAA